MRKNTRNTRILALSALMVALGVVMLYLGCFFEVIDLTVAAIASLIVLVAVIELGKGRAALIWLATSILALLLLPSKLIAAEYALLMGCYPIVKSLAERLPRLLSWVVKLSFVLLSMTVLVAVSYFLFSMPIESLWWVAALFAMVLFMGFIFDLALTQVATLYLLRLRKALRIEKLLK